jgi:hypothetical protein
MLSLLLPMLLAVTAGCARETRHSGTGTHDTTATAPSPTPAAPTVATSGRGVDTLIRVRQPDAGALVTSPLVIAGEARGNWYFEADFPARLLDADGREIAVRPVRARGEWMTTAFVPFEDTLAFTPPATATGVLVLEKSNPSGLPEHAAEVRIPVRFR